MLAIASARLTRVATVLSAAPLEINSPEGRARERHRRVVLSAGAAALAKALSVFAVLITIPLTYHYLGAERYGLWMTVSSFVIVFSFADMGIGNGLMTMVADAHGRGDRAALERGVAAGYLILTALAALILFVLLIADALVSWSTLLNVQTPLAASEVGPAMRVLFGCFALGIPLALVQRIQSGLQEGFRASLWQCVASVFGLVAVLAVIHFQGGLAWLAAGVLGGPVVVGALNTALFFSRPNRGWRPDWGAVDWTTMRLVARTGLKFFTLQLVLGIAFTSDSFLISRSLGPAAVTEYAVPEKLFAILSSVMALVVSPLWPAYGEALARGDDDWARSTLQRSILVSGGVSAIGGLTLVLLAKPILSVWIGGQVEPSWLLLIGLAFWKFQECIGQAIAMYANATGLVRREIQLYLLLVPVAVSLKWLLIRDLGPSGAPLAMNIAYAACVMIPWVLILRATVFSKSSGQGG